MTTNLPRLDEAEEFALIFRIDKSFAIGGEFLMIREVLAKIRRVLQGIVRAVTYRVVSVEVDVVDASVIGGKGIDDVFLLRLVLLLRQKLLLQRKLFLQFLLLAPVLGFGDLLLQRHLGGSSGLHVENGEHR